MIEHADGKIQIPETDEEKKAAGIAAEDIARIGNTTLGDNPQDQPEALNESGVNKVEHGEVPELGLGKEWATNLMGELKFELVNNSRNEADAAIGRIDIAQGSPDQIHKVQVLSHDFLKDTAGVARSAISEASGLFKDEVADVSPGDETKVELKKVIEEPEEPKGGVMYVKEHEIREHQAEQLTESELKNVKEFNADAGYQTVITPRQYPEITNTKTQEVPEVVLDQETKDALKKPEEVVHLKVKDLDSEEQKRGKWDRFIDRLGKPIGAMGRGVEQQVARPPESVTTLETQNNGTEKRGLRTRLKESLRSLGKYVPEIVKSGVDKQQIGWITNKVETEEKDILAREAHIGKLEERKEKALAEREKMESVSQEGLSGADKDRLKKEISKQQSLIELYALQQRNVKDYVKSRKEKMREYEGDRKEVIGRVTDRIDKKLNPEESKFAEINANKIKMENLIEDYKQLLAVKTGELKVFAENPKLKKILKDKEKHIRQTLIDANECIEENGKIYASVEKDAKKIEGRVVQLRNKKTELENLGKPKLLSQAEAEVAPIRSIHDEDRGGIEDVRDTGNSELAEPKAAPENQETTEAATKDIQELVPLWNAFVAERGLDTFVLGADVYKAVLAIPSKARFAVTDKLDSEEFTKYVKADFKLEKKTLLKKADRQARDAAIKEFFETLS
jgi:hypothetical protein